MITCDRWCLISISHQILTETDSNLKVSEGRRGLLAGPL